MKIERVEEDDTSVTLDLYNSDLNLVIDGSRFSAYPLTNEGFAFMWAGARATYGTPKGKTCYEAKVTKHLDVSHLPVDEPNPHVVRVGFSVESTTMQLGEDPLSYGYGGTGKISTNCQFKDYGGSFAEGDCITALLNMDSDPVQIGFAKNGRFLGWAYRVNKSQLQGTALFPHILTKNCSFEVNLGQKERPFFPLPDGFRDFTFIGCVPLDLRERGTKPPLRREDCEMIMMCGLPGAGKSVWAADFSTKNPEKKYNVLGTNNIIDKMKVMGLPRKRNYHGRWDVLIQMATKCLNKMFEIGSKLRRNYILDQTNVYPTAQRRKMRNFDGFQRRAVVVVPSEEEYKRRCNKRDREEGKEIPDHAVLEMKANFKLPEVSDIFDEVIFTELPREESEKLVDVYNEEGKAAVGPNRKQFRQNEPAGFGGRGGGGGGGGFDASSRGSFGNRGGFEQRRGGYDSGSSPNTRGGFDQRRGGSPNNRGGGYNGGNRGGGGYNGGGRGGGGYNGGNRGGGGGYNGGNRGGGRGGGGYDGGSRGGYNNGGRGGYRGSQRGGYEGGGRGGHRGGYGGGRDAERDSYGGRGAQQQQQDYGYSGGDYAGRGGWGQQGYGGGDSGASDQGYDRGDYYGAASNARGVPQKRGAPRGGAGDSYSDRGYGAGRESYEPPQQQQPQYGSRESYDYGRSQQQPQQQYGGSREGGYSYGGGYSAVKEEPAATQDRSRGGGGYRGGRQGGASRWSPSDAPRQQDVQNAYSGYGMPVKSEPSETTHYESSYPTQASAYGSYGQSSTPAAPQQGGYQDAYRYGAQQKQSWGGQSSQAADSQWSSQQQQQQYYPPQQQQQQQPASSASQYYGQYYGQ